MRDTIISAIIGAVLSFMFIALPLLQHEEAKRPEAVRAEQAKAVQAGVGNYELDPKTGQVVFKYVNLQEYTNWVVTQVRAQTPKGMPLQ